jgi:hypothetical protein
MQYRCLPVSVLLRQSKYNVLKESSVQTKLPIRMCFGRHLTRVIEAFSEIKL